MQNNIIKMVSVLKANFIGLTLIWAISFLSFDRNTSNKEISHPFQNAIEERIKEKWTNLLDTTNEDTHIDEGIRVLDTINTKILHFKKMEPYAIIDTVKKSWAEEEKIFNIVEYMPSFPDGNVMEWIGRKTDYPLIAAYCVYGTVYVRFVIEKDGSVNNVEVVRGVDTLLDKEALRIISTMPKWIPGKHHGKPVRVYYTLPVKFQP